jgi:ATP-dependent helicase/nuclease subunit A
MQEYRRLLYVALTRARDRLYVCGYEAKNGKKDDGCWHDLILPAMRSLGAVESIDADGAQILRIEAAQENAVAHAVTAKAAAAPQRPPWLTASAAPEEFRNRIAPSKVRAPLRQGEKAAMALGAAVHDILLRLGLMARVPELSQVESWAAALLDSEQAKLAALEAFRIRTSGDFAGLFTRHARGEVPFSIIGQDGARIVGRFDRIVLSPGAALVVEFKTTRQWPKSVAEIGDSVREQLSLYAHAARVLFPGRAISMELIWTAAPMRMALPSQSGEQ